MTFQFQPSAPAEAANRLREVAALSPKARADAAAVRSALQVLGELSVDEVAHLAAVFIPALAMDDALTALRGDFEKLAVTVRNLRVQVASLRAAEQVRLKPFFDAVRARREQLDQVVAEAVRQLRQAEGDASRVAARRTELLEMRLPAETVAALIPSVDLDAARAAHDQTIQAAQAERAAMALFSRELDEAALPPAVLAMVSPLTEAAQC